LPGDKFTAYELSVFDVAARKQTKPSVDRLDFGSPRLRWGKDGHAFAYQKVDRGHQRLRVIEVDALTGTARNLIDERTKTFIWTAHTETLNLSIVNWLEKSDEIIYVSESNGWRHAYLIDAKAGALKNPITKGEWIIRGIDKIDEEARQVWFRASGVYPKQDPYLIHYGRVKFDGSELTWLTASDGNHAIAYSPDRKYIIDTFSRVDLPPMHELRRVSDGKLVCELERADVSDADWEAPEVFVAKARDGKTDIWGIITRPRNLDPNKKYPVIEDIYAGPQGSFVPKTFSATRRYASQTDLGFILVKMDGMGTANRSKAFHDACWHNLKDAGFEDRILWMKAAAAKYPYMDLTRVGVYGTSAGGQNAAAAVLFHPEFYKVAVAGCGCHDNRMDKASWNEQWMGYMPPDKLYSKDADNWYSACSNIDNAHRLRGKLMLILGEMDNNVPIESTHRLVDALIKAKQGL
jgi:dipeptidyl aminopeptidase/acylaminoacyl peptidase